MKSTERKRKVNIDSWWAVFRNYITISVNSDVILLQGSASLTLKQETNSAWGHFKVLPAIINIFVLIAR